MTNADRIRNMTDEELADYLGYISMHCIACGAEEEDIGRCFFNTECRKFIDWLHAEIIPKQYRCIKEFPDYADPKVPLGAVCDLAVNKRADSIIYNNIKLCDAGSPMQKDYFEKIDADGISETAGNG